MTVPIVMDHEDDDDNDANVIYQVFDSIQFGREMYTLLSCKFFFLVYYPASLKGGKSCCLLKQRTK